jgi:ectoine hydroxylase-related dioxygenase (phytanoyl-CoA dioxygenase family)
LVCDGEDEGGQQKRPPCEEAPEVIADGSEHGVDRVARRMGEIIAAHAMLGFHVADDRLNGGPSPQLAFDVLGDVALLTRDINLEAMRSRHAVNGMNTNPPSRQCQRTALPFDTGFSNWKPGDGDGQRNNEFVSLQVKELHALAVYPLLGAIAAKLTRSTTIRVLDDQLNYKPSKYGDASSTITGWHADRAYWATCSSDKLITGWIPLHSVDVTCSPLVVMAGSHRWQGLQEVRFFNNQDLAELEKKFREQGKDVRVVPMILKKGQVSFHHGWTLHASYPNTSGQPRLSLAVHLQDGDNHYRPYRNAQGTEVHIFDEKLCRKLPNGDPDFSDPSVFPTVWSDGD